jgi:pyridoxal 5'-phosphate synthase / NAD(P)H-hydrate epimerase
MQICYPKPTKKPLYDGLVVQCKSLQIPFIDVEEFISDDSTNDTYNVIIDALFGFSFKGPPRQPFDRVLSKLAAVEGPMVAAVDIPSGWHVEEGDVSGTGYAPAMLVSLTAPKLCAQFFKVRCVEFFYILFRKTGDVVRLELCLLLAGRSRAVLVGVRYM